MSRAVYQLDSSGQPSQGEIRYPPRGPQQLPREEDVYLPSLGVVRTDSEGIIDDDDPYRMNNEFYNDLKTQLNVAYPSFRRETPRELPKETPRELPKEAETPDDKFKQALDEVKKSFTGTDNAQRKREAADKIAKVYLDSHPDKSKIDIADFKAKLIDGTSITLSRAPSPSAFNTIRTG